jgi:hypothetical protein
LHSSLAGQTDNNLHVVTFTPITPSTIKDQGAFLGFDGFFGRGQVDGLGAGWDGDVFEDITFSDNSKLTLEFLGDTQHDDIGAVGFDEIVEPGKTVASLAFRLDATGAWNEVKQFDFSTPGAISSIPEPRTWAMLLIGFGLIGLVGWRNHRMKAMDMRP